MRIARLTRAPVLAVVALVLTACATGPNVRTDFNPQVDFTKYDTFGWVSELGTERAAYSILTTNYFKESVRQEMEQLGYTYNESDPDLLVNFYANIRESTETYATHPSGTFGYGYYGYRYGLYSPWPRYGFGFSPRFGYETVHYTIGTVNIDVIDANKRQLIWEGVAEGRLIGAELEQLDKAIANTVNDIFERFPTRQNN